MKQAAIYLRVSSSNGQKFDSQLGDLKRWVEINKPEKVKTYEDKFTGTTMERPGMEKLMADVHRGEIDTIVCWRLDRLGRTAAGLTKLFEDLILHKCNLVSLKDNLDLSTPAGRFTANILASVASFETEIRGERVKSGQQAAKSKGKKWGGSKRGKRRTRTAEKAEAVQTLYAKGMSKAEIARSVGVSVPTVYSIIHDSA